MTAAAAPLLTALLAQLGADATVAALCAGRVYDTPPRNALYPYLVVDALQSDDRSGVDAALTRHRLEIRAFGRDGKPAALALIAAAAGALDAPITVTGHRVVLLTARAAEARLLKDRLTAEAVLAVTVFTEPDVSQPE